MSKFKYKWVGLRCEHVGKARRYLRKIGFRKSCHSDLNNRNGFDFILPAGEKGFLKIDFDKLKCLNFKGLAIEFLDVQWERNSAITDCQWKKRIPIN